MRASASALPARAGQPQVTGPTEISEAATVSEHAQPGGSMLGHLYLLVVL